MDGFTMGNPIKMDDFGIFWGTPISGNFHMCVQVMSSIETSTHFLFELFKVVIGATSLTAAKSSAQNVRTMRY